MQLSAEILSILDWFQKNGWAFELDCFVDALGTVKEKDPEIASGSHQQEQPKLILSWEIWASWSLG